MHVGADHERTGRAAGADELLGDPERVDEAGAHRLHVERGTSLGSETGLQPTRGGRVDPVRGGGPDHDEVEIGPLETCRLEGPGATPVPRGRSRLPRGGDAPFADAGTFPDPLVGGIDGLRELVVGEHPLGEIAAVPAMRANIIRSAPAREGRRGARQCGPERRFRPPRPPPEWRSRTSACLPVRALDDGSAEPHEDCAVVGTRVDAAGDRPQDRPREHSREAIEARAPELAADHRADHPGRPLARLEGDVACEPVADHDVRLAAEDPVSLHEPDVVEVAPGDELSRLANPFVALDLFLPNVEETDPGVRGVVDRAHQGRPHDRELEEVLRGRVHVRAEVEHMGVPPPRGQGGDNRGPVNARQGLQHESRDGEQGPRVPRAHACIGFTARHEIERDPHRRIPFRPQRLSRWLVHLDLLAGVVDTHALRPLPATELGRDALGIPRRGRP